MNPVPDAPDSSSSDSSSPPAPLFPILRAAINASEPIALATVVSLSDDVVGVTLGGKLLLRPATEALPDGSLGTLGNPELDRVVERDMIGELASGTSGVRHYGPRGEARQESVSVFIESFAPPPQMLIFGAVDFTAALSRVAKILGYRVTVCDARPVFATTQRFPYADEVVVDWPHRLLERVGGSLGFRDAICILTHDPKFDVPAVIEALRTKAGYIGAMGSRRTTDDRNKRLRDEGVTDEQLATIMAPIGLDLGARTPEETAISIVGEVIALRSGRIAPSLRDTDGDIHR